MIWCQCVEVQARKIHSSRQCPVASLSQESSTHRYWPNSSEVLYGTRSYHEPAEEYHLQWLASLPKTMPAGTMGLLKFQCNLTIEDGLVLKGNRIVVPASMRNKLLQAIYLGHYGEIKSILQARESVFWPSISTDIRRMVKTCEPCKKHQPAQPKLPILQPDLLTRPWEKLSTDIFEFHGEKYFMVVDYFSRFPVIRLLNNMISHTVCNHFTRILAC